jgi:hypothetical protein
LALGQHGGQPRSRTHQVPGRTQTLVRNPHTSERKKIATRFKVKANGLCLSKRRLRSAKHRSPQPLVRCIGCFAVMPQRVYVH